jgi:thioredoxin-related protein
MFDKSIIELNEIVKSTLKNITTQDDTNDNPDLKIDLDRLQALLDSLDGETSDKYQEPLHIAKLKEVLEEKNKINTIVYTTLLCENIKKLDIEDTYKTDLLLEISKIIYDETKNLDLTRDTINQAMESASILTMYSTAGRYYCFTKDIYFSKELYRKAIKKCYEEKDMVRLYWLGKNMEAFKVDTDWAKEIQEKAQELKK